MHRDLTFPGSNDEQGKQADLLVLTDLTDPVEANYAGFLAETMSSAVNREIYKLGAQEGQAYAITLGGRDLSDVPPEVIADGFSTPPSSPPGPNPSELVPIPPG